MWVSRPFAVLNARLHFLVSLQQKSFSSSLSSTSSASFLPSPPLSSAIWSSPTTTLFTTGLLRAKAFQVAASMTSGLSRRKFLISSVVRLSSFEADSWRHASCISRSSWETWEWNLWLYVGAQKCGQFLEIDKSVTIYNRIGGWTWQVESIQQGWLERSRLPNFRRLGRRCPWWWRRRCSSPVTFPTSKWIFKFKIILMMSSLPSGLQWNHCHRLIGKLLPKIFNFGHLWNLYQGLGANVNSRMHGISKPHKYKWTIVMDPFLIWTQCIFLLDLGISCVPVPSHS